MQHRVPHLLCALRSKEQPVATPPLPARKTITGTRLDGVHARAARQEMLKISFAQMPLAIALIGLLGLQAVAGFVSCTVPCPKLPTMPAPPDPPQWMPF